MYGRELKHPHRYNPKQLWSLIHEHMVLSGLPKTAEMLRTEKDFVPLVPDSLPGPPVYPHTGLVSFPQMNRMFISLIPGEFPPVPPLKSQSCLGWHSTFPGSLPHPSAANPNHCKRVRNHDISWKLTFFFNISSSRTPARPSAAATPSTPRSSTTPSSSQSPQVRGISLASSQVSGRTASTQPAGSQPGGRLQGSTLPAAGTQLPIRVTRPSRNASTASTTPVPVSRTASPLCSN